MNFKRKLWWAQHKDKIFRIYAITLTLVLVILGIIYFSYSKFSSSNEMTMYETTVEPFIKNDYFIASYINGEWSDSIPGKDAGYVVDKIVCDNGATGTWDNDKWAILIENATKKIKCSVFFKEKTQFDFGYTGTEQVFSAPKSGTYKIELWGASAGNGETKTVSRGSFVSGIITLEKEQKLFVYVGENGNYQRYNYADKKYRYNGGAYGNFACHSYYKTSGIDCSGGGATDIRIVDGKWDDFNSLKSRIMVAAGGGGSDNYNKNRPSNGGGLYSENGGYYGSASYLATGATQTSAGKINGKFGIGGYATYGGSTCNNSVGGGGGGGYYGGGGSSTGNTESNSSSGSGGSSFISGHNGCDAIKSDSIEGNITHTGQSIHYSGLYFTDTVMIDGAGYNWTNVKGSYVGIPKYDEKSESKGSLEDGYARITFIE